MVTHDPVAAAYADRVLFLADGRIVDEMQRPTAEAVLDRMKRFDVGRAAGRAAPSTAPRTIHPRAGPTACPTRPRGGLTRC